MSLDNLLILVPVSFKPVSCEIMRVHTFLRKLVGVLGPNFIQTLDFSGLELSYRFLDPKVGTSDLGHQESTLKKRSLKVQCWNS